MPPTTITNVFNAVEKVADALPSPASLVKGVTGLFHTVPIQEVFDPADRAGFIVVFGDKIKDGVVDARLVPIRSVDGVMMAMPGAQVGPHDIPVTQVVKLGAQSAVLIPGPVGAEVSIALGAVAGAAGMLEHLALKG